MATPHQLIKKYDVPGPRYTSYPTVPNWSNGIDTDSWMEQVKETFSITNEAEGISLYIHLPFCERLCTYCGCNKRITKNHAVEEPYIDAVLSEWQLYVNHFPSRPFIRELHLGGGTPTFFSPQNLDRLIDGLRETASFRDDIALSFEAHPANTSKEHLQHLYDRGFERLSLGIQDFDPIVQKAINRIQSVEEVQKVTDEARAIGYTSINYDLIFGLPFQTPEALAHTVKETIQLKPDRIAFYSYAHVPWKAKGQRAYDENDLPKGDDKRRLYELGKNMLLEAGYVEIGMDHFALPTDELYEAFSEQTLYRNFMGYTDRATSLMIGLGVSSISDAWFAFAQNEKFVEAYQNRVKNGELPLIKGYLLSHEDVIIRQHILNLMCRFETSWNKLSQQSGQLLRGLEKMDEFVKDGLVKLYPNHMKVTEIGKPFIRNICMAFDAYLDTKKPYRLFSSTI